MAFSSLLPLSLCLLFLFHGCFAQIEQVKTHQREQHRQQRQQRQGQQRYQFDRCQLQNINALEPDRRIRSEAGETEIWDQNEEQLECAGVVVVRHTIQQRGLLLPSFNNAPELFYVEQGRGVHGAVFPGCPETYQSTQSEFQRGERGEQTRDQHQKVRHVREGDIIAMPAGVSHWIYNNGQNQLVLVALVDTGNHANRLDQNFRKFFLAGNPQEEIQGQVGQSQRQRRRQGERGQQGRSNNIFGGFDQQLLAEAFNIDSRLAQRLQSKNDQRGIIVRVEQELEFLSPEGQDEEERRESEEEREEREERQRGRRHNGLEETFCTMRLRTNLNDPRRADVYNPRGGRISTINSFNLPLLQFLHLSAEKGVLYRVTKNYTLNI